MPAKLERCVKAVMEQGKSEESAYAICNAQLKDSYTGHFRDAAIYDPVQKTAVSVRDGVIEYLGLELGLEPQQQLFTVYRSPATIANAAMKMNGIPITQDHVSLDVPPPESGGTVDKSEMIDASDPTTITTIAIKNRLSLSDTIAMSDSRELSLGYNAQLIPHNEYDFEQVNILPHHLAVVPRGRCGPMCSFIDKLPIVETPNEDQEMFKSKKEKDKLHSAFIDADGAMNLQQIVELAAALPEAIKAVPVDQLNDLLPALQQIVEAAKGVLPPEETSPTEEETPAEEMTDESMGEKKPGFTDADVKKFTDEAVKKHASVIDKAREFVDETYVFTGKSTGEIMRDALATQSQDKFSDAELDLAFKLLKKNTNYQNFGDVKTEESGFSAIADKEL